jgi:DNA-binding CsgD family transcriptional regulator
VLDYFVREPPGRTSDLFPELTDRERDVLELIAQWLGDLAFRLRLVEAPLDLTPTEERVETLAVRGLTNREIADELLMGAETVKTHLSRILDKRGVRGRRELQHRAADDPRQSTS